MWAARVLQVIMTVLRDGGNEMCQRAMDVLLSVVQHDAGPLRDYYTEHTDRDDFKLLLKCGPPLPCHRVDCLTLPLLRPVILAACVACLWGACQLVGRTHGLLRDGSSDIWKSLVCDCHMGG